jgi:molybdopterin/thiamine biosynthesis adenylyltransferase
MHKLTQDDLKRYSRHILLEQVGVKGQEKLLSAKVVIIGAGGLGSPISMYLAAAGIGNITIIDGDIVELSNLQRQIVHFTKDIGNNKTDSAKDKMSAINPDIHIDTINEFAKASNIRDLIRGCDFVVDATDSFASKFLINDACVLEGIPFSHGGILRFHGQSMTINPKKSACYRCLFTSPPPLGSTPTCAEAGVLGAIAGMLGTIQATEVLKYITKAGDNLFDRLLTFDALSMDFRKIKIKRDKKCAICGDNPTIKNLFDEEQIVYKLDQHCKL